MAEPLRVSIVATEYSPLAKDSGRADIIAAIAQGAAQRGHAVSVFLPAYRDLVVPDGAKRETAVAAFDVPMGTESGSPVEPASLIHVTLPHVPLEILLVHHRGDRRFFDRSGLVRDRALGNPHADNAERFAFFGRAVLEAHRALERRTDLVHLFDARTSWVAGYLKRTLAEDPFFVRTGCLLSVLDWSDQAPEPVTAIRALGLAADADDPWARFKGESTMPILKVGLRHADLIALPSTRFAEELREDRALAGPLGTVLATRVKDLTGVVPGIDTRSWDPARDPALPQRYSVNDPAAKTASRMALAERAGWPSDPAQAGWERPIVGLVASLKDEKGLDLVKQTSQAMLGLDMRFFVVGVGDPAYHMLFEVLARRFPEHVHARLRFDDALVRQVVAGADLLLVPSRYEAGGRHQLRALRYGTPPIVHATGGLFETVKDFDASALTGTGFTFTPYDPEALIGALKRALETYQRPHAWERIVKQAMSEDWSWAKTAAGYEQAYREVRRRVEAKRFSAWALGVARSS
ncbi:MAG: glycogen synthase [Candidatus Eiseniibacteriota bacterium]